ncbi:hypothetical protein GCM10027202_37380 [Microvirgula curvata]
MVDFAIALTGPFPVMSNLRLQRVNETWHHLISECTKGEEFFFREPQIKPHGKGPGVLVQGTLQGVMEPPQVLLNERSMPSYNRESAEAVCVMQVKICVDAMAPCCGGGGHFEIILLVNT